MDVMHLLTSLLVFVSSQSILGQKVKFGKCPDIEVEQHFDLPKFLGGWYQYASFGTDLYQGKGSCQSANYSYNCTTRKINVFNSQKPKPGSFLSRSNVSGSAEFADPEKNPPEGKLVVTLDVTVAVKAPLWVLKTDYSRFALMYSCVDLLLAHAISAWILTRERGVASSPTLKAELEKWVAPALEAADLERSWFQLSDQTNCTS